MCKTKPLGMWRFSFDYYCYGRIASKTISRADPKIGETYLSYFPAYFLFLRAIELCLKAFIMKSSSLEASHFKGISGHDLTKLIDTSINASLFNYCTSLKKEDVEAIKHMNEYYGKKDFEYLRNGAYKLFSIEEIDTISGKLLEGTCKFCSNRPWSYWTTPIKHLY